MQMLLSTMNIREIEGIEKIALEDVNAFRTRTNTNDSLQGFHFAWAMR